MRAQWRVQTLSLKGGRGVVLIYLLLWVFSLLPFLPFLPKIREPAPLPKLIKSLPIDLFEAFKIESYCVIDLSMLSILTECQSLRCCRKAAVQP